MLTGTALAQALPLLAAPLLARLYSPEAFGLQTLFMGVAASLAVLATCRMDLALLLPERESELSAIVGFIAITTLIASVLTYFMIPALELIISRDIPRSWQLLLPSMIILISLYQTAVGLASRRREFRMIASASVFNQAFYVFSALSIGLVNSLVAGLVFAKLIGQAVAALFMSPLVLGSVVVAIRGFSISSTTMVALKYRQFLIFNTPYSLVGSVARDAPVYIFAAFSAIGAAGFFGLARMVLLAPTLLISNAFSLVFYREAVALRGTPRLQDLCLGLLSFGLVASAPVFAFVVIWGDAVFASLFGEVWREAGVFSMMIAPAAWLAVQTGWPERLFEVNARQEVSFIVQISFDALTAAVFIVSYLFTEDVLIAISAFALCNIIYHHAYLAAIFKVADFSFVLLGQALFLGWLIFLISLAVLLVMRLSLGAEGVLGWAVGLLLSIAMAVISAFFMRKKLKVIGETL